MWLYQCLYGHILGFSLSTSWADIGIRDDIRNLSDTVRTTSQAAKDSNASSFSTVTSDLATIRGSGQRIEASQAQSHNLLQGIGDHASSLSTVTSDLARIRDSGQRIEASQAQSHNLLQGIGDHASSLSTVTSDLARIRDSGQRIEASQAQSHNLLQGIGDHASSLSTVTSDLARIRDSGQRIEASQAQSHNLLQGIGDHASSLSTVTSDLARIRDSGQRIEASQAQSHNLLQGIGDHASSLSTVTSDLATIRGSGQRNEASQAQCHSLLQGISNRLPQAHGATHEKLDYIISLITGLQVSPTQSLSTTSASNLGSEELLVTFFRAELRRVLIPALEQSLVPFSEKEAILQTIERGVDLISAQMSEAATFRKPAACEEEQTQPPSASPVCTKSTDASKSNSSSGTSTSDHIVTPERDPEFSRSSGQRSKGRAPAKLVDRVWRINCRIGYLVTRFQRFRRRDDFSGHDPFFRISVMFYPSSRLITLPGLSVYFTDECDHRGHYQLCPLLATFPIISDHAPVWEYIEADDVEGVRNLFVAGLASPNDQNSRGGGLLTVCAHIPLCHVRF